LNWKFLFLNFEKKMAIPPEGNGNFWQKSILKFELKFEKNLAIPLERIEKIEMHHENLKWKKLKIFILKIWNENFGLKFEKKLVPSLEGNEKNLKWRNHIFRLCHWDKTFNNTHVPPMYTTLYHACKLWWYTINLNRQILSYWSFSNNGIKLYGPP
jgi:hypothetical protein